MLLFRFLLQVPLHGAVEELRGHDVARVPGQAHLGVPLLGRDQVTWQTSPQLETGRARERKQNFLLCSFYLKTKKKV